MKKGIVGDLNQRKFGITTLAVAGTGWLVVAAMMLGSVCEDKQSGAIDYAGRPLYFWWHDLPSTCSDEDQVLIQELREDWAEMRIGPRDAVEAANELILRNPRVLPLYAIRMEANVKMGLVAGIVEEDSEILYSAEIVSDEFLRAFPTLKKEGRGAR